MKIIVTGALGVVGKAVCNSIRLSKKYSKAHLIGLDTMETKLGLQSKLCDEFIKVPRCTESCYQEHFLGLLERFKPDALISNPELETLTISKLNLPIALIPSEAFCRFAISKKMVLKHFQNLGLCYKSFQLQKQQATDLKNLLPFSCGKYWVRSIDKATTGGDSSFYSESIDDIQQWILKTKNRDEFEVAEFLPGRNLACTMIFKNGELRSAICAERINYMLGHLVKSGITGYTSYGKVFHDNDLIERSISLLKTIPDAQNLNGNITLDFKESDEGKPYLTEINIRYIGFTLAYAKAGYNIVEHHIDTILNSSNSYTPLESVWHFYRGIDHPLEVFKT